MKIDTSKKRPADYWAGLRQNWKQDLTAGFIVFLIALPLSVGIAIASGAPPTAGLLAAMVGGIVGSLLGGSYVTINGPAAGMIVIVLSAVESLSLGDPAHGFPRALAAIAVAGLLQVMMGLLRFGGVGLSFPSSVIHGMMMAIGVIIMSKQAHTLLGVTPQAKGILPLLAEIPHSVARLNPEIAFIGLGSLAIVIGLNLVKKGPLKKVPAPLVAVCFGIAANLFFDIEHEHKVHSFMGDFMVGPQFLLNIPDNFFNAIVSPDFSLWSTGVFWKAVMSIALVGTIESVLSTYAVDKLDPYRRVSNLNRDLWSKGVCNAILGMIGGLPIISEIVRSRANVDSGARTRWSNFFHGVFILVSLVSFPHLCMKFPWLHWPQS
jgi:MFS superfamily sulfate permease-like transporter